MLTYFCIYGRRCIVRINYSTSNNKTSCSRIKEFLTIYYRNKFGSNLFVSLNAKKKKKIDVKEELQSLFACKTNSGQIIYVKHSLNVLKATL